MQQQQIFCAKPSVPKGAGSSDRGGGVFTALWTGPPSPPEKMKTEKEDFKGGKSFKDMLICYQVYLLVACVC